MRQHIKRIGAMTGIVTAIILASGIAAGTAQAASADASMGKAEDAHGILSEYCSACHEIPGYTRAQRQMAVKAPSFSDIAAQPDVYSDEKLRDFLRQPHYPMKKFTLSKSDINNLIAFIDSLR